MLFEEGHTARLANLIAEICADGRAKGRYDDEGEPIGERGAARTTIMMSVTPGMGSGTKDESTMETRKSPKSPKLKKKRISPEECRGAFCTRTRHLRLRDRPSWRLRPVESCG